MKLFKKTKLNPRGFSLHYILPLIVIAVVAGVGYKIIVGGHADTPDYMLYVKNNNIWEASSNGDKFDLLSNASLNVQLAFWGSNASSIFFTGQGGISSMTSSGANVTHIGPNYTGTKKKGVSVIDASFSEANQLILYEVVDITKAGETTVSLHTMNAAGLKNKVIYSYAAASTTSPIISDPQWSPDGTKVMFILHGENVQGAGTGYGATLMVAASNGSGLATLPVESYGPNVNLDISSHNSWSTNSQTIVYQTEAPNYFGIYTINANGTGNQLIYQVPAGEHVGSGIDGTGPQWSPNGNYIVALTNQGVNQTGEENETLDTLSTSTSTTPVSTKSISNAVSFDISPDGNNIALIAGTNPYNLTTYPMTTGSASAIVDSGLVSNVEWSQQ